MQEAISRSSEINPDMILYSILVDTAVIEEDLEKLNEHTPWLENQAKRHGHKLFEAITLRAQAVANRLGHNHKQAVKQLKEAEVIFLAMDTKWQIGRTYYEFGNLYASQDNKAEAERYFEQAIECFELIDALPDAESTKAALKAILA